MSENDLDWGSWAPKRKGSSALSKKKPDKKKEVVWEDAMPVEAVQEEVMPEKPVELAIRPASEEQEESDLEAIKTPDSLGDTKGDREVYLFETTKDVAFVDGYKKLFVCCIVCSRLVLITADTAVDINVVAGDSSDLCSLLFTTCKQDLNNPKDYDRANRRPFMSKQIIADSRLHRIAETVAGGAVDILETDGMVSFATIDKIVQSTTSQCMVRSINTDLPADSKRSLLLMPFMMGRFM